MANRARCRWCVNNHCNGALRCSIACKPAASSILDITKRRRTPRRFPSPNLITIAAAYHQPDRASIIHTTMLTCLPKSAVRGIIKIVGELPYGVIPCCAATREATCVKVDAVPAAVHVTCRPRGSALMTTVSSTYFDRP